MIVSRKNKCSGMIFCYKMCDVIALPPTPDVSISLSESLLIVSEEVGVINITLTLYGSHSIPVSVSVYTVPASATGMLQAKGNLPCILHHIALI